MTVPDEDMDEVLAVALDEEPGSGLENVRVQFFLRHQSRIQQWVNLAPEAWAAVAASLQRLYDDLVEGAVPAGFLVARVVLGRDERGPVLYRPEWCLSDPELPDLAWALWWDKFPDPTGEWGSKPYCGLIPSATTTGRRVRNEYLKPLVADRLARGRPADAGFQKRGSCAVARSFAVRERWYEALQAWRQGVLDEFITGAVSWEPVATEAVRNARSGVGG